MKAKQPEIIDLTAYQRGLSDPNAAIIHAVAEAEYQCARVSLTWEHSRLRSRGQVEWW